MHLGIHYSCRVYDLSVIPPLSMHELEYDACGHVMPFLHKKERNLHDDPIQYR